MFKLISRRIFTIALRPERVSNQGLKLPSSSFSFSIAKRYCEAEAPPAILLPSGHS